MARLVREGVERLDRQSLHADVDVDVAEGLRRQPIRRAEPEDQALRGAVGDHFFAEMAKDFRLDALDLETGLVLDDPAGWRLVDRSVRIVEWNRRPGSGRGVSGPESTSVRRIGPHPKMMACPPSMIRMSASHFAWGIRR